MAGTALLAEIDRWCGERLGAMGDLLEARGLIDATVASMLRPIGERAAVRLRALEPVERRAWSTVHNAGLRVLVLKGALLGRLVYPEACRRPRSDLDLMVAPDDYPRAAGALAAAGWSRNVQYWDRELDGAEAWFDPAAPAHWSLDLHWRLSSHPALDRLYDFEALWAESVTLPSLGEGARGLCPRHALVHAVLHYYGGGHRGRRTPDLWLLDIDLLWRELDAAGRESAVAESIDRGIAALLLAGLGAAASRFGTPVDPALEARLAAVSGCEWRGWLVRPWRSWLRDWLFLMRCEHDWRRRGQRLRLVLLPPADHLRVKYPELAGAPLAGAARAASGLGARQAAARRLPGGAGLSRSAARASGPRGARR